MPALAPAMCRLYAFRANLPTRVECTLVDAQNALLRQSLRDGAGESHPDGWGIAVYTDGVPAVERRETPAWEDLHFSRAARKAVAGTVVAHVRQATVGGASLANTHPFAHGRWVFAHNGTVYGFDRVGPLLEREMDPGLLAARRGSTDSETVFLWLLGRMRAAGLDPSEVCADLPALVDLVAASVRRLAELGTEAGVERPAKLNFLLSDGKVLVATRWRKGLYRLERQGVHDCEICGKPHMREDDDGYRAAVVASEPITPEGWQEVPEASILSIDDQIRLTIRAI